MVCCWGSPSSHGLFPDPGCRGLCATTDTGQRTPRGAGGPRCRDPGQAPLPSPSPRVVSGLLGRVHGASSPPGPDLQPSPSGLGLWAGGRLDREGEGTVQGPKGDRLSPSGCPGSAGQAGILQGFTA